MTDYVDELFGEAPEEDEYYPGSKRKKRSAVPVIEFVADPWRDQYTSKTINGREVRLYTVGMFAAALGIGVPTLRLWTTNGYIPQAPYRLPSNMVIAGEKAAGRRLYTEGVIDATISVLEKHGLLGQKRIVWAKHPDVQIEIVEAWNRAYRADSQEGNA